MKIGKKQNRILLGLAIAALVAIFCYHVAYGMSETVTNGNITATMTAPPGSKINNTIRPENSSNSLELTDPSSIWTMMNSTSGSRGTIVFYTGCHEVFVKVYSYTTCATTFDRFLNDRVLKGTVPSVAGIDLIIEKGEPLTLCYGHVLNPYIKDYTLGRLKPGCFNLNPTIVTHDHIQFKDMHGGTIDLWPAIPWPKDTCLRTMAQGCD